jgi:hypothetical protein
MAVSYSGEDEIEGRGITPRPHLLPLFTGVRGIGILRSSYPRSCIALPRYPGMLLLQAPRIAPPRYRL